MILAAYVGGALAFAWAGYWCADLRLRRRGRAPSDPFQVIADCAPTLMWLSAPDGSRTFCNRSWLAFTGRTMEQEAGEGWARGVHPVDRATLLGQWRGALRERAPLRAEYRLRREDGSYRWVLDHGVPRFEPDGAFAGYVGSCVDITERAQADEAQARLAAIAHSTDDAIIGQALDGTITAWNRGAESMFGYGEAQVIGRPVTVLVPTDRALELRGLQERLRLGEHISNFETQRVRHDGRRIDVSLTVSPIVDARGRVIGLSEISRDIGERKRAQEEQRKILLEVAAAHSELEFQKFALDQHAIVAITDRRGRITYVNDRFCQISRFSREELLGQDHRVINSGHHPRSFFRDLYAKVTRGEVWNGEICNRAKDGSVFWVSTTIVPLTAGAGLPARYVAIRSDITERKRIEAQLEQSLAWKERMLQRERALLRELDHRVRNSLTGLLGLIGIYERAGKGVAETTRDLRGKVRAMIHVHELLSPERDGDSAVLDLASLVVRLADHCVGRDRRGSVAFEGPPVSLGAKQAGAMAMVLQELFTNSAKHGALSGDGSIRIAWRHASDQDGPLLELRWEDRREGPGGPFEEGVGLRLIRGFVSMELGGASEFSLGPRGFAAVLSIRPEPRESAIGGAGEGATHDDRGITPGAPAGARAPYAHSGGR